MKIKKTLFCFVEIISFSFLLNFLWESLHGFSLYTDHIIDSDKYVLMMVYMSFMDAVTILVMYLVCAFFMKDVMWLRQLDGKKMFPFFALGLFVAVAAEYWAVYIAHEWQYNELMPVILGIGLSPLFQLSVTGLLSIWITKKTTSGWI